MTKRISSVNGREYERKQLPLRVKKAVIERYGFKCLFCKIDFREYPHLFSVDHIEPLFEGGTDDLSNLIGVCRMCNISRRSMPIDDFVEYSFNQRMRNGAWDTNKKYNPNSNKWIKDM